MVSTKVKAKVYAPTRRMYLRRGKGFSIGEIREAKLSLHDVKTIGVPIDKRRSSSHSHNIQILKEQYGVVVPLTQITGVGEVTERNLRNADIDSVYDLAHADLNGLSRNVSYSTKTLQNWQVEAKKLLNKKTKD